MVLVFTIHIEIKSHLKENIKAFISILMSLQPDPCLKHSVVVLSCGRNAYYKNKHFLQYHKIQLFYR